VVVDQPDSQVLCLSVCLYALLRPDGWTDLYQTHQLGPNVDLVAWTGRNLTYVFATVAIGTAEKLNFRVLLGEARTPTILPGMER
jgi:hypothetical protein